MQKAGGERSQPPSQRTSGARRDEAEAQVAHAHGVADEMPRPANAAQILHLQRAAGNRAVSGLLRSGPATVQRAPSLSGLKKAVGLKKKTPAWAKAEEAGLKAQDKKLATTKDLQKQIDTLESASRKLLKSDRGMSVEVAATQVQLGANRVLFNMDNLDEKALKQRLTKVLAETQSVLDEARVARTKRDAQNIYLEAGRKGKGEKGALELLETGTAFAEDLGPAPAPKAEVLAVMKERGFSTYDQLYDDVHANPTKEFGPLELLNLDRDLSRHFEASRARKVGTSVGLSPAELDLDTRFPLAMNVQHITLELIHHGAEVSLLRDLYRCRQGQPL